MSEPIAERLDLPSEYGNPQKRLDWAEVEAKLKEAPVYWIASTRPDGRPHVVPRDGLWFDGGIYYGGSPQTVHHRNVGANPEVVIHIGEGLEAVIVEGKVQIEKPTKEKAARLADASYAKYPQYGRIPPTRYMGGVSVLRPRRVLAWTNLPENATRFRFD